MSDLEAMTCGTHVVTSNVFTYPGVAGATLFVDSFNIKEISIVILGVLRDIRSRREFWCKRSLP